MEKSPRRFGIFFYLLIFAGVLFLLMSMFGGEEKSEINYSELNNLFREEKVKSFVWEEGTLTLQLHEKDDKGREKITYELATVDMFYEDFHRIYESQYEAGIIESYEFVPVAGTPWYLSILPYLLVSVVLIVVFFFLMGSAN